MARVSARKDILLMCSAILIIMRDYLRGNNMKHIILFITLALILIGIYQVAFADLDNEMEILRYQLQIYISYSALCIIVALGGKE